MRTKITRNHQESDPEAQTGPGLGSTPALMTLFGEGEPRAQGIRHFMGDIQRKKWADRTPTVGSLY